MTKKISFLFALAIGAISVWANSAHAEYLFGPDEAWELMTPDDNDFGIDISGFAQLGYHSDNVPLSAANGDGLSFNDSPDKVNLHAMWLTAERVADGDETGFDWGFRVDGLYGTDAQKTQAFGGTDWDTNWDNGIYGWAIPQAYVSLDAGDLNIIAGHFFTIVGYEVVPATGNFFYSHALTMFNSEPFTHTGVLATYDAGDDVTLYGGWTLGWDTGFEQNMGGSNFIGGVGTPLTDDIGVTYIVTAGNFGARGTNGYSHSIVFNVAVAEGWEYVLQSDLVEIDSTKDNQVGVNQYLFYTIADDVKAGVRAEWWKNNGNSQYEVTAGLNVLPHANVRIRPEVRWDWDPDGPGNNITTFGIDAILTY